MSQDTREYQLLLVDPDLVHELFTPGTPRWRHLPSDTRSWVAAHRLDLAWLLPVLVLAGTLHGWNLHHAPGPNDDEGTYVSQAWSGLYHHSLAPYTYWYDHPFLGWLLLGGWMAPYVPFHPNLLYAGRDFIFAIFLASCVLMYVLARRLDCRRWAATFGVVLFAVSPLGMDWQRLTLLDNIGTPFLLAAWVLALSPRKKLLAYLGSGIALGMAVLIKETNALLAPAILAQVWFAAKGDTRRYAMATFLGGAVGVSLIYPLYAVLKNELFPGPGHVSLLGSLMWQLHDRKGSGSMFDPNSDARHDLEYYLNRDGLLLLGSLALMPVVALGRRKAIPLVVAYLILWSMPLRGGYIPAPYPVNLVWPGALLAAVGLDVVVEPFLRLRWRLARLATAAAVAAGSLSLVAYDYPKGSQYLHENDDVMYHQANSWLKAHLRPTDKIVVDETMWMYLVQDGYSGNNVVWFYKFDLDPTIKGYYPGGYKSIDYLVESGIIQSSLSTLPYTSGAIKHGTVVAQFDGLKIYRMPHALQH